MELTHEAQVAQVHPVRGADLNVLAAEDCLKEAQQLRNVAAVIDSTTLSDESIFEILTRHLPTYFFTDLKRFANMESKVSAVVYHQNSNCFMNRTLSKDEMVPPTLGTMVAKELRRLKHRKSTQVFDMRCAKANLFGQYDQFSVSIKTLFLLLSYNCCFLYM